MEIEKKIYFICSSITFLQYYIPLVIEFKKKNISSIFIYRCNKKKYADPTTNINFKILQKYSLKYNFKLQNHKDSNLNNLAIYIMIDGDILGPSKKKYIEDSLLFKLNKKSIKISLQEN